MKVTVLGSAAAEAVPALWCECENCAEARRRGGKDIRRRTAYCIDGDILVDCGPDIFTQCLTFGIDLRAVRRVIVTHQHKDHLSACELEWRNRGFSRVTRKLKVYGGHRVFTRLLGSWADDGGPLSFDDYAIDPVELHHGTHVDEGDFQLDAFDADHDPGKMPLIYTITRGGRKLLIGNDSGYFPAQTLEALAGAGADAAFLDSTGALNCADWTRGHMGVNTVVRLRDALLSSGALKPDAKVYANHFSHNGGTLQSDLEAFFTPHGIGVGFDGLSFEV